MSDTLYENHVKGIGVFGVGIRDGRVEKKRWKSKEQLSGIELANKEADEERERFKLENVGKIENEMANENGEEESYAVKYERRLKMNRRSAAASRIRKEAYVRSLEKHLSIKEKKFEIVQSKLQAVYEENERLKESIRGGGVKGVTGSGNLVESVSTARNERDRNTFEFEGDTSVVADGSQESLRDNFYNF